MLKRFFAVLLLLVLSVNIITAGAVGGARRFNEKVCNEDQITEYQITFEGNQDAFVILTILDKKAEHDPQDILILAVCDMRDKVLYKVYTTRMDTGFYGATIKWLPRANTDYKIKVANDTDRDIKYNLATN